MQIGLYRNYYSTVQKVTYDRTIYFDNPKQLINLSIKKGNPNDNKSEYFDRLPPYFTFLVITGFSFLMKVFFGFVGLINVTVVIFLHAKQYRLLAFWVAIVFYFGIITYCISGYVFVYRFKVYLSGATYAFEKIY